MAGQEQSALHKAALAWASAGFAVFPCAPNLKTPATAHGHQDATTDPEQIDRWWTANPQYNVAVAPGLSAMLVLDVDPPHGSETLDKLVAENGALPDTLTIRTPRGGLHHWFAGSCPSSVGTLGPNLDTRGEGGYVLVPPSIVGGKQYEYVGETDEIAEAPAWIASTLAVAQDRHEAREDIELDIPANVDRARELLRDYVSREYIAVEGQGGDNRTYQVACEVLNLGLSPPVAWKLMRDEWNPHCEPPWDEEELAIKVRNAAEYAQNEPGAWAVPPSEDTFAHLIPEAPKHSVFWPRAMNELEAFQPPEWLIPNLIPKRGTVQIIGKQKSFKTFLTLDMALGIASGTRTFGETPKQAPVVYAAGENAHALALSHVPTWRQARGQQTDFPFYIVPAVPLAAVPAQCGEMLDAIKRRGIKPTVVVLDTMTRAMRTMDENSAKDMGIFSGMCDTIQRELDCTVIVIRHTGKDESRGGRGSNVIEGDFDTTLAVERHEKSLVVSVRVREQRNAAEIEVPFTFQGEVINGSLVFFETDTATHKALTASDDPLSREKVGAALRHLGATALSSAVATHVLATELCPALYEDNAEAQAQVVNGFARKLKGQARGRLRAYLNEHGDWYLPKTED